MKDAMLLNARDPLLRVTRLFLLIAQIIFIGFGLGALASLIPAWVFSDHVIAWLTAHADGPVDSHAAMLAITASLVGLAIFDTLTILFMRILIAIIDSVGQGSPFIPENVTRLRLMGWLVAAIQGMEFLGIPLTPWLHHAFANRHFAVPFSLDALLTALLLFLLARVFAHGTRLAEDVEGTV